MRQLIAISLLFMLACSRPAPAPPVADAGGLPATPTLDAGPSAHPPGPPAESRMAAMRRRAAKPEATHPASPPDPRVVACTKGATDKAALMSCLDALKTAAPFASDAGAHVLAATRPPVINPAWSVPDWYVNPATGSDANTCVTSGAPCKTVGEVVARWETDAPTLTTAVTIHALADWPSNADWLDWDPLIVQGGSSTILGTMTTTCSATLSGVVAKTYAAGTADGRLQANLGACASGAQGHAIVNTSRSNSIAWVDDCIGSVCALTQPIASNVPTFNVTFPAPAEDDGWVNGNSFSLQLPSKFNLAAYRPTVVGDGAANDFPQGGYAGHIWIPNYGVSSIGTTYTFNTHVANVETRVDAYSSQEGGFVNQLEGNYSNSWVSGPAVLLNVFMLAGSFGNSTNGFLSFSGGLTEDAIVHNFLTISTRVSDVSIIGPLWVNGGIEVANNVVLDNDTGPQPSLYGSYSLLSGAEVSTMPTFQYTAPAITAFGGVSNIGGFCNSNGLASAYDLTVKPAQWYPNIALTPSALDATISSGGFAGLAKCDNGASMSTGLLSGSAPTAYVAPIGNGGTGLDAGCSTGQVLQSNGLGYICGAPSPSSVFVPMAGSTVNGSVTVLNSATIVVPTGKKLNIQMWFDFGPNTADSGLQEDMSYGDGVNSNTSFSTTSTVTISSHVGTSSTGRTSGAFLDQTSTTGSVTVYALAQVTASGAVNNPASAAILLTTTN
jgi:hypothetical protein